MRELCSRLKSGSIDECEYWVSPLLFRALSFKAVYMPVCLSGLQEHFTLDWTIAAFANDVWNRLGRACGYFGSDLNGARLVLCHYLTFRIWTVVSNGTEIAPMTMFSVNSFLTNQGNSKGFRKQRKGYWLLVILKSAISLSLRWRYLPRYAAFDG